VLARARKRIAIAVNKDAPDGVLDSAGTDNVQGEVQKMLDVISTRCRSEPTNGAAARPR